MISQKTSRYKVIFPKGLNNNATLFGGLAMEWMDDEAYITATRFTRKKMVTVSVCKVNLVAPVLPNTIVEISGTVQKVGPAKMGVLVEAYQEDMDSDYQSKAVDAPLSFLRLMRKTNLFG